jgi:hypothetical protein
MAITPELIAHDRSRCQTGADDDGQTHQNVLGCPWPCESPH